MTNTLFPKPTRNGTVSKKPIGTGLACAAAVRAACATLANAEPGQVTSTRVVAARQGATSQELRAFIAALALEFGLDAEVEIHASSFTARFHRRAGDPD